MQTITLEEAQARLLEVVHCVMSEKVELLRSIDRILAEDEMCIRDRHVPLANVTVMVQKEVAARMKSGPGSKDYGALSLAVQYYAEPYIVANVPCNCFMPRPNVDSAVIRLTRYEEPPVQVKDEKMLFKIIRASFNQRRKTLQNGLNNSSELNFTKDQIAAAIAEAGFSPSVRGEALTCLLYTSHPQGCKKHIQTS